MNRPSTLWSRPGLRLAGTGEHRIFDPGIGPDRYHRALEILRASGGDLAFASFTFDLEEPGSVVVVPSGVDRATSGTSDKVPIPGGIVVDDSSATWGPMVDKALGAIESGRIDKVVLARLITAEMSDVVDPYAIAQRLEQRQTRSYVFLVDRLVGASPELLLRFASGQVSSTPLAGSADAGEDLLEDAKAALEHQLAADSVAEGLTRSGVRFDRAQPEEIDFGDLRHLATRFNGSAPAGTTFADVLTTLHPTAAVAGTPRVAAVQAIRDLEGESRGRYSGPVGWFDRSGNGEFAIALRCGSVEGKNIRLRSGAGIVAGSDPDAELEETNWKFAAMLDALGLSIQVG